MAKPIEPPPEWASDETNNDEPAALQKQTGWEFEQTGVSDFDNWYKRTVQKWLEYVDSNVVDGDLEIDGNLEVDDDLDVDGDANFDGDIKLVGNFHHGERTISQGYDNAIILSGGGSFDFGFAASHQFWVQSTATQVIHLPVTAELIGGVSRVKSISVVFDNTTPPDLMIVVYNAAGLTVAHAPTTFVPGGVTVTDVSVDAFRARRTMVDNNPVVVPLGGYVKVQVTSATINTKLHVLDVTYDAPAP